MRSSDLKKKDRSMQGRRKVWKCGVRGFLIILLHLRRKKMSRKREPFSINFCFFVHKKYISNYFLSNYCTDYRVLVTKDFYGYWLPWLEIVDSHDWFWSKLCIPSTLNTRPFNLHLDFWKSRSWEIKICFKP